MPIVSVSKPRQIRIDLDPDQGFPVGVSLESLRYLEQDGVKVADLPTHIEVYAPDSDAAKAIWGELASSATAALLAHQAEIQRLAAKLIAIKPEADPNPSV